MKKSILLLLMTTVLLLGQSTEELKKKAKQAGITTEVQARELAKQSGMTDAQIEAEMTIIRSSLLILLAYGTFLISSFIIKVHG